MSARTQSRDTLPATPPSGGQGGGEPSRTRRALVALAVGALWFGVAYALIARRGPSFVAGDFTYFWRAARILWQGHDPYQVIRPTGDFPFQSGYYYPLPSALLTLPFAWMAPRLASATFSALSAAVLAYVVTRRGWARLLLFTSLPAIWAAENGQWAPLLAAACVEPGLGFVAVAKPNLGLAAFAARPSWRTVIVAALLVAVSVAILPTWPRSWLAVARASTEHVAPISLLGGPLLLLALLRWRDPDARLLVVMACVPQSLLFYDQLPLFVIPRTFRQMALFVILSHGAALLAAWLGPAPMPAFLRVAGPPIVALMYLPALALVLRRPPSGTPSRWWKDGLPGAWRSRTRPSAS